MFVNQEGKPLRDIDEMFDEYEAATDKLWELIREKAPKEELLAAYVKYRKVMTEYRFLLRPEKWRWVDD